jgi:hypothetical protein
MAPDFLTQASSTEKSHVENINVKTQHAHCMFFFFFTIDNDSDDLSFELCVEKRATIYTVCYFNIN